MKKTIVSYIILLLVIPLLPLVFIGYLAGSICRALHGGFVVGYSWDWVDKLKGKL